MSEPNNQVEQNECDHRREAPAVASPSELGAAYAALFENQVWQLDTAETAEEQPSAPTPETPAAAGEQRRTKESAKPFRDPARAVNASPVPLLRIVEALLFVGGGPLTADEASSIVRGLTPAEFLRTLDALNHAYRLQGRPYRIRNVDKGHEFVLRSKYLPLVEKMHGAAREGRLSPAALDVLALVAYRQPLTKQDIDGMRGAESGGLLRLLVRRGLLSVGHKDAAGQAESVYRTTRRFIDLFHLRGLEDLPQTQDLEKL